MKKKFKKFLSMAVALSTMVVSTACLTACGGKDNSKKIDNTKTQVVLKLYKGTPTQDTGWVDSLIEQFEKDNAETVFEEGKKGVQVTYTLDREVAKTAYESDGADIYLGEARIDAYSLAAEGKILDLSSIVTKLVDRIDPDALSRMTAADGKYYALPSYEWYAGVPYDIDALEKKNAFFAAPDTACVEITSERCPTFVKNGEVFRFTANKSAKKSCGPDGVYNTVDDGLPSSLQEFMVWCWYLKNNCNITPFIIGNDASQYSFYLTSGLWASMAGTDAMRAVYTNYAEGGSEVEVVTGYSNTENYYVSADNQLRIPMPTTETVRLTEENGYKAYDMSARYYSLAFLEIANKEGWIAYSQSGNTGAMDEFINGGSGGKTYAMLYDASYWYHEAAAKGYFEDWKDEQLDDSAVRKLGFLSTPTQVFGTVQEGHGKKNTLMNFGSALIYANAHLNRPGMEGKKEAALKFLEFMYTDESLALFTRETGLHVSMQYNFEFEDNADNFYYMNEKEVKENSNIVNYASDNLFFKKNLDSFLLSWGSGLLNCTVEGRQVVNGYLDAIRNMKITSKQLFEATRRDQTFWNNIVK